jgi:uncharacterized glyoxalase superfamily protein PhnB
VSAYVKPIPEGHQGAIPYLTVSNASEAIAFYKTDFGAVEALCITNEGMVGHAELEIGKARIMLSDEFLDHNALSPQTIGGTPVVIHLYVEDVDAFTARAVDAGFSGRSQISSMAIAAANSRTRSAIAGGSRPQGGYSARGAEQTGRGFVWWRRRLSPAPKSSHLAFWSFWQADNIPRTQKRREQIWR